MNYEDVFSVLTGIYQYILVRTIHLKHNKKMQSGLEPAIFCILLPESTPTLRGYILQRWNVRHVVVTVYIHAFKFSMHLVPEHDDESTALVWQRHHPRL